jgi:hypothetical protein
MRTRIAALVAFAALSSTLLCGARADALNLREVPLGGRTATMGGAGVDAAMAFLDTPTGTKVPIDFQANAYLSILSGAIRTDPN